MVRHPEMCQQMEVEQRSVVKYLSDEDISLLEIVHLPREHYGDVALPLSQVYHWRRQMKLARTDLVNTMIPIRAPDETVTTVFSNKIESVPHLSARKLAYSMVLWYPESAIV
jgi:hypothetical protein